MDSFITGGVLGLLAGGAIMYYIQPPVKDFVTKVFAGAPAIIAKARALQARAEDLIYKAKEKQAAAAALKDDGTKGNTGA